MNQVEADASPDVMLWEMTYETGNEECKHKLPGDWIFAGPTGQDPRADPRWLPVTYTYLDRFLRKRSITQVPFCDHVALGSHLVTLHGRLPAEMHIFYVWALRPGATEPEVIYSDMEGALSG